MARIPSVADFGPRPVPRYQSPRVVDQSANIVGDATERLAGTVANIAGDISARDDKFKYAQAKTALLTADIETRKSLENDQDYGTFETRYTEKMAKAREKAAALVGGKRDRALFEMDAKLDMERGLGEIRGQARRKEVDVNRGILDQSLQTNRTAALEAPDEATRTAFIKSASELIDGAVQKGYIRSEEGVAIRQSHVTSYADGFVDMQPLDKKIEMLQKPDGTPAKLLEPDKRASLLKSALNEQRILKDRADAEARAAQAEYRAVLSDRVRDASVSYRMGLMFDKPPSKAEFVRAYGPEEGRQRFGELQKDQDLSVELNALSRMPPAKQAETLAAMAPKGRQGAAEQAERYNILSQRTDALRRSLAADPATYVMQYSPRVQEAYSAFEDSDDPQVAQTFASTVIAEQQQLGVQNPQILPKAQAEAIAQSFYVKPEEGEKLAGLIQSERDKWGRYWPKVSGQLMQAKMPSAAIAIARGMDPGAATRLAGVATVPMAEMKNGVDKPPADVSDALKANMSDFQQTLDGVVGGENTFSAMYDAAERLSYYYLRQGKGVKDATQAAYNEVLGDHYDFGEVNNRKFRVPAGMDMDRIESGAQESMKNAVELKSPIALGSSNSMEATDDLRRTIAKRGYWVTSVNGERGLALFLDGTPVLKSNGSVYEMTWDELTKVADNKKQEANRRQAEFLKAQEERSIPGLQ
jgi:hypothetical protein